ncbi:hypothetical protein GO755_24725 [Spirosoma sp. HMF4905]|uniref:Uncharacterized protein n=1 Tax=Spirosoma arboris TaxID=2682092 RepID=A0A7K1SHR4_9BACT|nr:hypothetical protein [Spirosoma arboris]MVM33268.1 hypothetical protein [Spirosoma arboris]
MVDPQECLRQFNQFIHDQLAQKVKERLIQQAPTIDWSQVDIVLNAEANGFYFASPNSQLCEQLQSMFAPLSEDWSEQTL